MFLWTLHLEKVFKILFFKGATPRPAFNPPYPDKIRQLPKPHHGSIPLKTHGPFKIQPLYGLSPTSPTTTLGPGCLNPLIIFLISRNKWESNF